MPNHYLTDYTKRRIALEFTGENFAELARRYDVSEATVAEVAELFADDVEHIELGLPAALTASPESEALHTHLPAREANWLLEHLNAAELYWVTRVMTEAGTLAGGQLAEHLLAAKGVAPSPAYRIPPQRVISTQDKILAVLLPELLLCTPIPTPPPEPVAQGHSPCTRPVECLEE